MSRCTPPRSWVSGLLLCLCTQLWAQPETDAPRTSFAAVLQAALADNPDIRIADSRVDQAVQLARQNGSYRYPKLALSGAIGPEFNDPVPSVERGRATSAGRNLKLVVSRLLFDGGTSREEYERSRQLSAAARVEGRLALEDVLLEVLTHYIDYWRFQTELARAQDFVATMQALTDDLGTMQRNGAASKLEVDFARARLAAAQGVTSAATASVNSAFSELAYLVRGLQPFQASSPEQITTLSLNALGNYIEQSTTNNTELRVNELRASATRSRVKAQRGRFMPSLDLELAGSVIDDEGAPSERRDKFEAKLVLSYALYSGGERRAGVRRAQAQLREVEAERIKLEREVQRAIDQAYNNITTGRLTLAATRDEIAANRELQRLNRENLALGSINIIELIDVEERVFNASARESETLATIYKDYFDLLLNAGLSAELLASFPDPVDPLAE